MAELLTYRGSIYPWQCDHMGHMNVMWYAAKFDEATWQMAGALGLTGRTLAEARSGMVAAEQTTKYHAELIAGDLVSIRTHILRLGARSIHFIHEMRRAPEDTVVATATLVGVHIDATTRKPLAWPEAVLDAARAMSIEGPMVTS